MREEQFDPKWSWDAINAVLCFGGGILAGLIGSLLTSGTWIWGAEVHPWVRRIGTGLLIMTIPLLILAGHCLDRLENREKREAERRSRTGQVSRCIPQILTVGVMVFGLLVYAGTFENLYAHQLNSVIAQDDSTALDVSNRPVRLNGRKPEDVETKSTNIPWDRLPTPRLKRSTKSDEITRRRGKT